MSEHALIAAALSVWPFKDAAEFQPLDMGVEDGIVWAIARAPYFGVNGYALIPGEGHCWSKEVPTVEIDGGSDNGGWEESAAANLLEVHGGITFNSHPWIGFDTAHAGDVWEEPEFNRFQASLHYLTAGHPWNQDGWTTRWSVDKVIDEVKALARQLAALQIPDNARELEDVL